MEIINSFKKETSYEFSEAVPVLNDEIYIIFKVDIISIEPNPSKSKINKLKLEKSENKNNFISHLDIEPIAYLLKTEKDNESDYQINSIDERYDSFIEKNKNSLLEEFLSQYNKN